MKKIDLNYVKRKSNSLAQDIVVGLKERLKFPLNIPVYDNTILIKGKSGISLLEMHLRNTEESYAQIGRYAYSDQYALTEGLSFSRIRTQSEESPLILEIPINTREKVLELYLKTIESLCVEKTDLGTFGQTVDCDVRNLIKINEFINLGRQVAHSKYRSNPKLRKNISDEEIIEILSNQATERKEIDNALKIASKYELNNLSTELMFKDMIRATKYVELKYIRALKALNIR